MPTVRKTNVLLTRDFTWKFKGKASDDNATSVLRYKDDFADWQTRCPLYGDPHPDLPDFKLTEIEADREPGDQIAVTLTYEANTFAVELPGKPGAEEATARYSASITGREEHILTNPFASELSETELKALLNISNGSENKDDGSAWDTDVTSENGIALLSKIRKGNVACKSNSVIYTERKLVNSLSEINYSAVNKRQSPPGPATGGAANWLYIGANADPSEDGETWTLERQWEFSPTGWDPDLYPAVS
jgi:hypothetical protein